MTKEENIAYLSNAERYPKMNRSEPVNPLYQVSCEEWNRLVSLVLELMQIKQDLLKSGENIKTINNVSIVGGGNITITGSGEGSTYAIDTELSENGENPVIGKAIFSALDIPKLTQDEYDYLILTNKIRNRFYSIYNEDDKLKIIYLGKTVIWEARPETQIASVAPFVFPFVFT